MVSFYKPGKGKSAQSARPTRTHLTIDDWDWQGQGVVRGKPVTFVSGALPGERCEVSVTHRKKQVANGRVINVEQQNPARQLPFCPVAGTCGGCQLQHVDSEAALTWRQQAIDRLIRNATGQAVTQHMHWKAPLTGNKPAYRRKARLAVDARNPDKLAIGYRARQDNRVIDIEACPVLVEQLSVLIAPLKKLLRSHSGVRHVGHIGLLAGESVSQVTIKATRPLSAAFTTALSVFAKDWQINLLVDGHDGVIHTLHQQAPLHCYVSDNRYISPGPNDFIQVNHEVNRAMIAQAIDWLEVKNGDVIADWFCGLGNFWLPLADLGVRVQAIEGVADMVRKAKHTAQGQGISGIDWQHLDLADYEVVCEALARDIQKVLLDPSREGASVVCQALVTHPVERILYISCNPSTFSRDAGTLTAGGYQLEKASLIEMFPYTQHLEMMALFTHPAMMKRE
ncbi:23S rRNA (uracil(1939)-C(5))-methyltransferase RlmD [Alteromonas halophila]|uniref:23S rRNA (Uracil(1939)-C(5))-methyltransferase RlmD n=1 Tax=Alteromonas halophila TaxID=516698 RepID=A0A918JKR9_9ALTE|nr:23S rRNA (uracil(1939)-C(5))-methyltransferase RlmD [Alteromonas halophila]GGW80834.1 23S rRNA (uracil(1939)-C(5))-methyltransferase RlmD [Alteromonas halophila]